jgi:predicted nucleotidyltransferase
MPDSGHKSQLEEIVELFSRHGVEFLIIGGQAEALFGSPRVTYDYDFCYRRSKENLERLARALKELNPALRGVPPDLPFQIDARSLALGENFTFKTRLGDIDLLGWVEPLGNYDALLKHAETYPIGESAVRTISLEDLIRVKEHIRRPKDRDSLFQLQAIKRLRQEGAGQGGPST